MVMANYIDNKQFEKLIKQYVKGDHKNVDELMGMFDLLINNVIDAFHFNIEKEDAKQDCFYLILKTLKNFDSKSGAAFNYFTTIIINNLKLVYTKKKRYQEKINNYCEYKYGYNPSSA